VWSAGQILRCEVSVEGVGVFERKKSFQVGKEE